MIAPGILTETGFEIDLLDQAEFLDGPLRVRDAPNKIFMVVLEDPAKFFTQLPSEFQSPTQRNPHSGLPANVWPGVMFRSDGRYDLRASVRKVERLVDIRARVRWVMSSKATKEMESEIVRTLSSWRCSNCGRRGPYPRPKQCPHASILCGDAKLEPQIHWYLGTTESDRWRMSVAFEQALGDLGVVIYPDVPEVRGLTTRVN